MRHPLPRRDEAQSIIGAGAATDPHPGVTQMHEAVRHPASSSERAKQPFAATGVVAFLQRQELLSRQSRAWRLVPREGAALHPQCNHRPWNTLLKQFLRRANYRGLPIVPQAEQGEPTGGQRNIAFLRVRPNPARCDHSRQCLLQPIPRQNGTVPPGSSSQLDHRQSRGWATNPRFAGLLCM